MTSEVGSVRCELSDLRSQKRDSLRKKKKKKKKKKEKKKNFM
jgi:hypothetical protein